MGRSFDPVKFLAWCKELLAEDNGCASAMRVCFVLAICTSLGISVAIVIHGWDHDHDLPANVKDFLIWLTTALGLGKVGQKALETKDTPPPPAA
jgi:hypothetical protein